MKLAYLSRDDELVELLPIRAYLYYRLLGLRGHPIPARHPRLRRLAVRLERRWRRHAWVPEFLHG